MALFNLPKRDNKEEIISKAKKTATPSTTSKKSVDIKDRVTTLLGKYKDSYLNIISLDDLKSYVDKCIEDGIVSIDTETEGLDNINDKIVGVSLKSPSQRAVYIPINHLSQYTKQRISTQLTEDEVSIELQRLVDACGTIWHNAKFDIRVFNWQLNVKVPDYNVLWDTYVGANMLNENEAHGLKYLYCKYITNGEDTIATFGNLFGNTKFSEVPLEVAYIYAGHDAEMTLSLFFFQYEFLNYDNYINSTEYAGISYVFNMIEMPSVLVSISMEDTGVCIDKDFAKELSTEYTEILIKYENQFYEELSEYSNEITAYHRKHKQNAKIDKILNYNSPSQLAILLYDIIGVDVVDKDNPRGTGEEIISQIDLPICKTILKCREYTKLLKTYIDKLPNEVNLKTNKLHARFNPCGTVTGRFSSDSPNLQNLPSHNKEIRKMFVAREGHVFVGSDYSQQEPRILAHMSGDENLIQAYKEGKDIYAWVASMVYKMDYDECRELNSDGSRNVKCTEKGLKCRKSVKSIVLGVMYSKGAASIAEDLHISTKEAENLYNTFFESFPKVRKFIEDSQEMARVKGYVTTAWGRKRRLPNVQLPEYEFSRNEEVLDFDPLSFEKNQIELPIDTQLVNYFKKRLDNARSFKQVNELIGLAKNQGLNITSNMKKINSARRQCVNSRIQGSAADMVKLALINLYLNEELRDLGFKLVLTVHDEIIGECPIENSKRAAELLSKIMIETSMQRIDVPMRCDVTITKQWGGEEIK